MGLFDLLRAAVVPAADARAGYLQGQDAETDKQRQIAIQDAQLRRQSTLDQNAQDLHRAQMGYYNARSDALESDKWGDAKPMTVDGQPVMMQRNLRTGEYRPATSGPLDTVKRAVLGDDASPSTSPPSDSQDMGDQPTSPLEKLTKAVNGPTASSTSSSSSLQPYVKPSNPAAPRLSKSGVVNPQTGMVEDVFSDGTRTSVRKATSAELARANRVPGSGGGKSGSTPAQENSQERYFNSISDSAMQAADAQIPATVQGADREQQREQRAMQILLGNPKTADVFTQGMSSRHIQAASQRFADRADKQRQSQARAQTSTAGAYTAPSTTGPMQDESTLSDADLWEKKVADGMSKDRATAYVKARKKTS